MPENKHLRFFLTILYIALGILGLWFFFNYAFIWFLPFIIAFAVSRIIERPVSFFKEKLRFPRPLASALFTILFYGIIGTILYFAMSSAIKELVVIFEKLRDFNISETIEKLEGIFNTFLSKLPLISQDFIYSNIESWLSNLVSALRNLIGPVISSATNIATALPSVLIFIIAAIVSTYFFSSDYYILKEKLISITPDNWKARYRQTKNQVSTTLVSYLRAVLVLVCVTFVELTIGFALLRVSNPFLVAAVVAIIDALPILGTGWVLLPWGIIALFSGNYLFAIGLAVIYVVVLIVRNLLEPKIIGSHIGLHPLATLAAMYVGLKLFGIIGMFMPIPIALIKQFYEWGYFDFLKASKNEQ